MMHPAMTPETVQLVDQLSTLIATAGRTFTTHELTVLAPARVISGPCAWGTCLPRGSNTPGVVVEWHDRETHTHFVHVQRSSEEVGEVLSYLVAVRHLKFIRRYKAWLWVGPVPVSADRLEQMWALA